MVRSLLRTFLRWRADARREQLLCRHDGSAPLCLRCACIRFPLP